MRRIGVTLSLPTDSLISETAFWILSYLIFQVQVSSLFGLICRKRNLSDAHWIWYCVILTGYKNFFPNSFYWITAPHSSNHSPINTILQPIIKLPSRFLYRNYWITYPQFKDIISSTWNVYFKGNLLYVFSKNLAKS